MSVGTPGLDVAAGKATTAMAQQEAMQNLQEEMTMKSKVSAFGSNLRMAIIQNWPSGR